MGFLAKKIEEEVGNLANSIIGKLDEVESVSTEVFCIVRTHIKEGADTNSARPKIYEKEKEFLEELKKHKDIFVLVDFSTTK